MTSRTGHDPYSAVHKGIRAAHMRCLVGLGAADASDAAAIERLIARIEGHLTRCNTHLRDENSVLHTALEDRRPGASAHAAEDHDDHMKSFAGVRTLLERIAAASGDALHLRHVRLLQNRRLPDLRPPHLTPSDTATDPALTGPTAREPPPREGARRP